LAEAVASAPVDVGQVDFPRITYDNRLDVAAPVYEEAYLPLYLEGHFGQCTR